MRADKIKHHQRHKTGFIKQQNQAYTTTYIQHDLKLQLKASVDLHMLKSPKNLYSPALEGDLPLKKKITQHKKMQY